MYLPGESVIYSNKKATVLFRLGKEYTIVVYNYRGFKEIYKVVPYEDLCYEKYVQIDLFNRL
jgi:hypothetical protein